MKKRSPLYPLTNLQDTRNFSVSVYEKAGESSPLKYADLAKFGNVPVREADSFASAARQYGWMESNYGKGYKPIGSVCTILRKPQGDEEKQQYLIAFTKPDMYQKIISEYQGKTCPADGLEIFLIRNHHFSDSGAKQCATVFLQNANFLGLINEEGVFNSNGEVTIKPIVETETKHKKQKEQVANGKSSGKAKAQVQFTPKVDTVNNGTNGVTGKTINVFIKGKRFVWTVPTGMNQSDWDDVEVQIRQIKEYAK